MRSLVVGRMQTRSLSTSSLVLSRPLELHLGRSLAPEHLASYLKRIGYRLVSNNPSEPGTFNRKESEITLYTREFTLPSGQTQQSFPLEVEFRADEISSLRHAALEAPVRHAALEPEVLSVLGTTESRATIPLSLGDYPPHLINALLAIEDERFYAHFGVDPLAIARALYQNLRSGEVVQGGSTITQQLAKNLFLTPERSLSRKIKEAAAAVLLETAYSKEEILEMYMNEVFLGQEGRIALHGFGEAAQAFFNKPAQQLELAEAATLAGIVKAPSAYSPRSHPERALKRRRTVLKKMLELGFIDERQRFAAAEVQLSVQPATRSRRFAPYFVDFVRSKMEQVAATTIRSSSPLHVMTGLDRAYQLCAEQSVAAGLARLEKERPWLKRKRGKGRLQAALISVSSISGEVRAWVGGRNYQESQFDRISQAKRQPGSAFKPFIYLAALDGNLNSYRTARVSSTLLDEPLRIPIAGAPDWEPKNYDGKFRGEVTVREALAKSLNVPAVYLIERVGTETAAHAAEMLGIPGPLPRVPSIALGSAELTPLELTRGYASIAAGGRSRSIAAITALVKPQRQETLWQHRLRERRVADEAAVFVLTNILQSAVESGTGAVVRRLGYKGPAAGKTGTTTGYRDAWFVGYTPSLLTTVWVGFDDNSETKLSGSSAAAPIWAEYMKCVEPLEPELEFVPPATVVFRDIDLASGLLATRYCPRQDIVTEVYVQGTEPLTPCTLHAEDPGPVWERPRRAYEPPVRERSRPSRGFWDWLWR